ncbi:MAG: helix-turn-helix domain-containing protein [Nitrososphaeraceae archaeon]
MTRGIKNILSSISENREQEDNCNILNIWNVLSRRWSLLILRNLSSKNVIRFNELKRNLKGISSTVLSDRLAELEQEGLVTKKIYPEIPIKVEYRLTNKAKDLELILENLSKWCQRWELKRSS